MPLRRVAAALYSRLVEAARDPVFYRDLQVADTIEGRYEMIVLHLTLVLRRLRVSGGDGRVLREARSLSQALVDFTAADLDRSMRELGIGDLSVARYMKRLGEGLFGRAAAYDAALECGDAAALAAVLLRNVYAGTAAGGAPDTRLAVHVMEQGLFLNRQDIAAILAGRIEFTPPAAGRAGDGA
jgi:cytochrome b pre-mRNA-processing protein 3